jgi:hypothetical protein
LLEVRFGITFDIIKGFLHNISDKRVILISAEIFVQAEEKYIPVCLRTA